MPTLTAEAFEKYQAARVAYEKLCTEQDARSHARREEELRDMLDHTSASEALRKAHVDMDAAITGRTK